MSEKTLVINAFSRRMLCTRLVAYARCWRFSWMVVEDSSVVLGGSFFIFGMAGRSSDRPRQPLLLFFCPGLSCSAAQCLLKGSSAQSVSESLRLRPRPRCVTYFSSSPLRVGAPPLARPSSPPRPPWPPAPSRPPRGRPLWPRRTRPAALWRAPPASRPRS